MKYALTSDLHIDRHQHTAWDPSLGDGSEADVLVVAGDTSNTPGETLTLIQSARQHYRHVVFLDGNHDHYLSAVPVRDTMAAYAAFADQNDGVHYLNGERSIRLGDTLFVGATGWYDFTMAHPFPEALCLALWQDNYSDEKFILWPDGLTPRDFAIEQAAQLRAHVAAAQDDDSIQHIVVTTHMIPISKGLLWKGQPHWDICNAFFGCGEMRTVWEADRAGKIKVWNFGHTHFTYDFAEHGIRFVSNPRGNPQETRAGYRTVVIDPAGPSWASVFAGADA